MRMLGAEQTAPTERTRAVIGRPGDRFGDIVTVDPQGASTNVTIATVFPTGRVYAE
jgi:hypothetical protein